MTFVFFSARLLYLEAINMNKNKLSYISLCYFLLVSYTQSPIEKYRNSSSSTNEKLRDTQGNEISFGKKYSFDLGRRNAGIIGQYIEFTVESYKIHKNDVNGYIYSYKEPIVNPGPLSTLEVEETFTIAKETTYSCSQSVSYEINNSFAASLKIQDFVQISQNVSNKVSTVTCETYSVTYGQTLTQTYRYKYDLSVVPSGYGFSPCIVCNATELTLHYTIYDHYWWGDFESRNPSEVNQTIHYLIVQPDSYVSTICIKKLNEAGKPTLYYYG